MIKIIYQYNLFQVITLTLTPTRIDPCHLHWNIIRVPIHTYSIQQIAAKDCKITQYSPDLQKVTKFFVSLS